MLVTNFQESCSLSKVSDKNEKKINPRIDKADSFFVDSDYEDKKLMPPKISRGRKHYTHAVNLVRMSDAASTGTIEAEPAP